MADVATVTVATSTVNLQNSNMEFKEWTVDLRWLWNTIHWTQHWSDSYLLSLLDGGHGVWLELQLVCPTQFPVQDGNDDDDHEEGNHHSYDDPHVGVLSVRGWGHHLFNSYRRKRFREFLIEVLVLKKHHTESSHVCLWFNISSISFYPL